MGLKEKKHENFGLAANPEEIYKVAVQHGIVSILSVKEKYFSLYYFSKRLYFGDMQFKPYTVFMVLIYIWLIWILFIHTMI